MTVLEKQHHGASGVSPSPIPLPTKEGRLDLSDSTYKRAQQCVHCGLCLPACPTYTQNGLEADSPRGRIYLMKAMADGRIEPSDSVMKHLDLCLDCRACETACPSGVVYHELIEETRAKLRPLKKASVSERLVEWITLNVMTRPTLLKLALLKPRVLQRLGLWSFFSGLAGNLLGSRLGKMQQMLPESGPLWPRRLDEVYPARAPGERKLTVGFLPGCVGSVMFNEVNRKAIELLTHLGCEVLVPRSQGCCGAMHHHAGFPGVAAEFAKRNIEAFRECDRVVNTIAGCGAMLKEYGHLLHDDPAWAERASEFDAKSRDISELIAEIDAPKPPNRIEKTVTYHDACHLAHAQKVRAQPRKLLGMIDGVKVVPLPETEMCCGAAGTYNLMHPEMSQELGQRKVSHIRSTGAAVCVTGNVGCAMQIESEARRTGSGLTVLHPVDLLHEAYFGRAE